MKLPSLVVALLLMACSGGETAARTGTESEARIPLAPDVPAETDRDHGDGTDQVVFDNELLRRAGRVFKGDLPELRERRFIRVLASYSKTSFFHDGPRPRGFEVELLRAWEKELNQGASTYERVRLVFVPTPFDRLLEELRAGRGDIAAAGLTITADRERIVSFSDPYIPNSSEVVVHHRNEGLERLEDLAGRRLLVRGGSTYVGHLEELNRRHAAAGLDPIGVVEADPRLVTEDLLEMVNAGAVRVTVADRHIAEAWAEVLPDIRIRTDLAVHEGAGIAWAVRQDNPELLASLNAFVRGHKKGSLLGNILFKRYYGASKWIRNPLSADERAKLDRHLELFQKYAAEFGFDWLALAAQAYQESGIDQSKVSSAGAVGVMQIKPSTAADKWVGVEDVHLLENNIHAGTKYLAFLRDRYFDDPEIEPAAQVDFAWAAYNAGPARVRRLRLEAQERGLDANRWFQNVEKIAAEEIGRETVDYVANINKYYLAYRLQYEAAQGREAVRMGSSS